MNKSRFVCVLAAVTMCTAGWAKDIPFKAVFTGIGGATPGVPCIGMQISIDTRGIVTDLGLVRTIQTHCVDPNGADPLAFTNGVVAATNTAGDGYKGTYSGRLVPTVTSATDNVYTIDGQFTITDGTGRYVGVTGGGKSSGLQNSVTGYFGLVLSGTISVPDTVTPPKPTSNTPIANAGADITTGFKEFTLDGSKSSDPLGGTLTYSWRNVGKTATIIDSNVATPRIQVLLGYGLYTFELTVTNSKGLSSTDTVDVMYIGH